MTDARQMRTVAESRMTNEGQANAGGARKLDSGGSPYYDQAPLSEYPRMLYRKTEHEQVQEAAEVIAGLKDEPYVINRFEGMLCETCIAASLTEAEALAELGWETSPRAAYGMADGLGKTVSAKDERIAELEALLAVQGGDEGEDKPRRGRPPRINTDA